MEMIAQWWMAVTGSIPNAEQFHFLRPHWLWLVPVALGVYLLLRRNRQGAAGWERVCDPQLLQWLTRDQSEGTAPRWPWRVLLAAWLVAIVALAGPTWERQQHQGFVKQWPRVFVVDLSSAMLATDLAPNRLQRARFKLEDFLAKTEDEQVALVTFTREAYVAAPLTNDANTISALLDAVHPNIMPVDGHDVAVGLQQAAALIHQAGAGQGEIIVFTDHADSDDAAVARELAAQGIRISVVGVGTPSGAPVPVDQGFLKDENGGIVLPKLDTASLNALADAGNGRYSTLRADERDVQRILSLTRSGEGRYAQASEQQSLEVWLERGPWLVLLLLPLALLGFRRGWLLAVPLFLLPVPRAEAGWWDDLWLRRDQQARQHLDAGDVDAARGLTQQPLLSGEALYRAGEFEDAAQRFAAEDSAQAHYNRANALAKNGDLEEALAAYDDALSRDPDHSDAQHNKAIVEALLEQQQDQQQQDQQQQDQQQQDQQQQDQQQQDQQQQDQQQQDQQQQEQQQQEQQQQDQQQQDQQQQDQQQQDQQQQDQQQQDQQQQDQQQQDQQQQDQQQQDQQQLSEAEDQELSEEEREQLQAMEQWLRRVPDDPGGLLRAKFLLEHRRKLLEDDEQ